MRGSFKLRTASNFPPSHGSEKIFFVLKNSESKPAFVAVEESSLDGDIKTTRALAAALCGNASSVSNIWFTAPSLFGQTTTGVACKAIIKARELKFQPSGLSKPPAPSMSKTLKRFCSARMCATTPTSETRSFSQRAASNGAMGARKCHGLISPSVSMPSDAV